MLRKIFFFILLISSTAFAQKVQWQHVDTKTNASFRGLSVVNGKVAWVSGSKGWVGVTVNGGRDWSFKQVAGFEQFDFRSLYAFDKKNAVIANAGAPAYILRTADGGATWQKVYENDDSAAFIDGVDFWDTKHGIVYGDPINGHMLLLRTDDGGKTWAELPLEQRPILSEGEASFAASGTCIKCMQPGKLVIATGGKASRLFVSDNSGMRWKAIRTPIFQGDVGTGIFSFLALDNTRWVIAGGDYKRDSLRTANLFLTNDAGRTWYAPITTTGGYRECLAAIEETTLLAVGPGGIDISYDNGNTWAPSSDEKQYHVVKKGRKGNLVVIAGGSGKLAILRPGKK